MMGFNNMFADRQTQSGPLIEPLLQLGRRMSLEITFKYKGHVLRQNSLACIGYGHRKLMLFLEDGYPDRISGRSMLQRIGDKIG